MRILLCEDEALTALHLQITLSKLGYELLGWAPTGEQAVELALQFRPDVILMDVNLPGIDGIQAVRQIMREAPTTVIMLTARSDAETVREALSNGASGYLVKPFGDTQLLPTISIARSRFLEQQAERAAAREALDTASRQINEALLRAAEMGEAFRRERAVAKALAESFLCAAPEVPGIEIETVYEPASVTEYIGGDYFDFIRLAPQRLGVVIADACGKGLAAARLTGVARQMLRAYAVENPAPEAVLTRLNRALCGQTTDGCPFLSLVYGVLELDTFDFIYANAGHPPPVLWEPDTGSCSLLPDTGGLLGLEPAWSWRAERVSLPPGGVLTFYTDGIAEARGAMEQFGTERISRSIEETLPRAVTGSARALAEQAHLFAGGTLADDAAIVVVRRVTDADSPALSLANG